MVSCATTALLLVVESPIKAKTGFLLSGRKAKIYVVLYGIRNGTESLRDNV
jgi:hypothetical protein